MAADKVSTIDTLIKNIPNKWSTYNDQTECSKKCKNCINIVCTLLLHVFELILYYIPIIKTKIIEITTFTIRINSHFTPIQIGKNEYVLITGTNFGDLGRCLVNVFYKRYSPYDINMFIALMEKYLQTNTIKFNLHKFTTINGDGKNYAIEIKPNNTVFVNDKQITMQLYSIDLKYILAEDEERTNTRSLETLLKLKNSINEKKD